MTEHDPLGEAGARLRGAIDPGAFDPDWDAQARRRKRNRAGAVASVAAALAIVVGGVAVLATGDDDGGSGQVVATAPDTVPTPTPTTVDGGTVGTGGPPATDGVSPSSETDDTEPQGVSGCLSLAPPFTPTFVPDGWSAEVVPGLGGGSEIPNGWHYSGGEGRFIDVTLGDTAQPQGQGTAEPIVVLGREGTIGGIHEGYSVEFPTDVAEPPCDRFVLAGYGISRDDLRAFAEGLVAQVAVVVSTEGVLGWWDGTWQDVDGTSADIPVPEGQFFAVVGIGREDGFAFGGAPEMGCWPLETYTVPLDPPLDDSWLVPGQIAVSATWEVVPRAAAELDPTSQTYLDATAEILSDLGLPGSPAHLDQVVRADLDGDGTDEVLLVGRHPDANVGNAPRAGWYSFVALRSVVDGEVRTDILDSVVFEEDDDSYPNMTTFLLDAAADLNGDGQMEVVYGGFLFEGATTMVVEWAGPGREPTQVLSVGCGV
jgi:hypothetical protein